ncbi:MAG TPA: ribonuclease P protein component [Ottowia sp.]|nr:ribonuclease P protein component [Ottowia sp.]HPZ57993.1 ribonuclease P protein component [Ottowia sp.]HQD46445.1 ribonuclease P protein component [Ottowia sp.]
MVSGAGAPVAPRRLRTRAQFQALLANRPVSRTAHFALHRLRPQPPAGAAGGLPLLFHPPGAAWVGAMVPKRWARRAVTRNAIRRQIYAVCAELQPPLADGAHLVRLSAAFAPRQFASASSDALKRAVRVELRQLLAHTGQAG